MPNKLRLTGSRSSTITNKTGSLLALAKKSDSKSPRKRSRTPEINPDDGDDDENAQRRRARQRIIDRQEEEPLQVIRSDPPLEWESHKQNDLLQIIRDILNDMWDPLVDDPNQDDSKLSEKSRASRFKLKRDDIPKINASRQSLSPVVALFHIQALSPSKSPTYVERLLQRGINSGKVRRIVVGGVTRECAIISDDYYQILHRQAGSQEVAKNFENLLKSLPSATTLSSDELQHHGCGSQCDINLLIKMGFLTLSSSRGTTTSLSSPRKSSLNASSTPDTYYISVPNLGTYLKLMTSTRDWVTKLLSKAHFKEMLETMIQDRFDALPTKVRWIEFKGVSFHWLLSDIKWGGWAEAFDTPVGRGWKLTGKRR